MAPVPQRSGATDSGSPRRAPRGLEGNERPILRAFTDARAVPAGSTIDTDLVIIGGGPAGLSTALHLQHLAPRLAERTVVLEAERYPREKICAGG